MQKELQDVAEHIKELGLAVLSHSLRYTLQEYFISSDNTSYMEDLGVIQAAHACELLIKARIAQEHPLLIFSKLPESKKGTLDLELLAESGMTFQYNELPERLWAATGCKINEINLYKKFGKLRNAIQHFATPRDRDLSKETLEFLFAVVDPLIHDWWELYVVDYYVDNPLDPLDNFPEDPNNYEPPHNDIFNVLLKLDIQFLVSKRNKKQVENDVKNLNNLVRLIRLMEKLPNPKKLKKYQHLPLENEKIINGFSERLSLPYFEVCKLYGEAFHILKNPQLSKSYKNWRITI